MGTTLQESHAQIFRSLAAKATKTWQSHPLKPKIQAESQTEINHRAFILQSRSHSSYGFGFLQKTQRSSPGTAEGASCCPSRRAGDPQTIWTKPLSLTLLHRSPFFHKVTADPRRRLGPIITCPASVPRRPSGSSSLRPFLTHPALIPSILPEHAAFSPSPPAQGLVWSLTQDFPKKYVCVSLHLVYVFNI